MENTIFGMGDRGLSWVHHEGHRDHFVPSTKGDITFTNVGTKEKLHSHDISVFGADAYEVTAYHGNYHNNHWAISHMNTRNSDASHGFPARPPLGTGVAQDEDTIRRNDNRRETKRRTEAMDHYMKYGVPSGAART